MLIVQAFREFLITSKLSNLTLAYCLVSPFATCEPFFVSYLPSFQYQTLSNTCINIFVVSNLIS